jgi:hypothetical protein
VTALAALPRELRRTYVGRLRSGGAGQIVWRAHAGDVDAQAFIRAVVDDARRGHVRAGAWADELADAQRDLILVIFDTGGFDLFKSIGDAAKAIGNEADKIVKPLGGWSGVLSDVQGVVSMIPGIGTGISAAIGAASAIIGGGGPLVIALKTAYGAIPIPPGIRNLTDGALDAIIALVKGDNITDAALAVIRDQLPEGIARQAFDTLAHVVAGAVSHGKAPPIQHAPAQLQSHYSMQYTQGLGAAVAHGLNTIVPPAAAAKLVRAVPPAPPGTASAPRPRPAPPLPPIGSRPSPATAAA